MSEAAPNPTIIPEQQPVEQAGRPPEVANLPPSYDFGRSNQLEVLTRTPATIEDALGVVELIQMENLGGEVLERNARNQDLNARKTFGLIGKETSEKVLKISVDGIRAWLLSDADLEVKEKLSRICDTEQIPSGRPKGYSEKNWNDFSDTQKKNVWLTVAAAADKELSAHYMVSGYMKEQRKDGAVPANPRKQQLARIAPLPQNNHLPTLRNSRGSLSFAEMQAGEAELRDKDSVKARAEDSRRKRRDSPSVEAEEFLSDNYGAATAEEAGRRRREQGLGKPQVGKPGGISTRVKGFNGGPTEVATTTPESTVEPAQSSVEEGADVDEGLARDMHTGWLQSEGLPASERNLAIVMADGAKGYEHLRREAAAAAATPESAPVSTEAHVPSGGDLPRAGVHGSQEDFFRSIEGAENSPTDGTGSHDADAGTPETGKDGLEESSTPWPGNGLLNDPSDDFFAGDNEPEKTGRLARISTWAGQVSRSARERLGSTGKHRKARKLGSAALTGVRAEEPFTEVEGDQSATSDGARFWSRPVPNDPKRELGKPPSETE